mmetsp:Transcript_45122/g.57775  ORF Transcript_45122/g.57775 Transcript_45122/m.57775 type:complete len:188 (-) Transcript_45122:1322-1885(-)
MLMMANMPVFSKFKTVKQTNSQLLKLLNLVVFIEKLGKLNLFLICLKEFVFLFVQKFVLITSYNVYDVYILLCLNFIFNIFLTLPPLLLELFLVYVIRLLEMVRDTKGFEDSNIVELKSWFTNQQVHTLPSFLPSFICGCPFSFRSSSALVWYSTTTLQHCTSHPFESSSQTKCSFRWIFFFFCVLY